MIILRIVKELGSGQFGVVWLAEAIGISAFHPRDVLKEKERRRRFSFLFWAKKRKSYVNCKEVTKVAVKKLKGLVFILYSYIHNNGMIIYPRANGAKRRSERKPGARVTNSAVAELKVVARGS